MTSQQRDLVDQLLRTSPFDLGGAIDVQRPLMEQMLTDHPAPADVHTDIDALGGIPVVSIDIDGVDAVGTILFVHGGGFALGSARASVGLASDLARRAGMRAITVDYRLAPEHPFPAAIDDTVAAYRALLDREQASRIVLAGESAGGNLAAVAMLAIRDAGLPQPAAALLMSPMTDLTVSGASFTTKAAADPKVTAEGIRTRVADYLQGTAPTDPMASPLYADLTGLPPLLIQAGSHEVLLDDATRLAARAAGYDIAVTLDITPGVPHVFQAFAALLDEADAALNRAAEFLRARILAPIPA